MRFSVGENRSRNHELKDVAQLRRPMSNDVIRDELFPTRPEGMPISLPLMSLPEKLLPFLRSYYHVYPRNAYRNQFYEHA